MKHSRSLVILNLTTNIIKVILNNLKNENLKILQNEILWNTKLILIIYKILDCPNKDIIISLADVFGLLVEGNDQSFNFFKKLIPNQFLKLLEISRQQNDWKIKNRKLFFGEKMNNFSPPKLKLKYNWPHLFLEYVFFFYNLSKFRFKKDFYGLNLIWNNETRYFYLYKNINKFRNELKTSIFSEIQEFDKNLILYPKNKIQWNFEEFQVFYKSLQNYHKIGNVFLKFLTFENIDLVIWI